MEKIKLKVGDRVKRTNGSNYDGSSHFEDGDSGVIESFTDSGENYAFVKLDKDNSINGSNYVANLILIEQGDKMEIKEIKAENKLEGVKQAKESLTNAEIEFAKQEYKNVVDRINEYDRQIKSYQEAKKPYEEKLKQLESK